MAVYFRKEEPLGLCLFIKEEGLYISVKGHLGLYASSKTGPYGLCTASTMYLLVCSGLLQNGFCLFQLQMHLGLLAAVQ